MYNCFRDVLAADHGVPGLCVDLIPADLPSEPARQIYAGHHYQTHVTGTAFCS